MRTQRTKRWTALALTLVMALSLAVPALGATPMMTGDEIAETPVTDAVGTMPVHSHSPAVADDPADGDGQAEVMASANVLNFTTDTPTGTIFTVTGSAVDLPSGVKAKLTGDAYKSYTKGLLLTDNNSDISLTPSGAGRVEITLAHPSENKGFRWYVDGVRNKPTMTANPCVWTTDVQPGHTYALAKDGTNVYVLKIEFVPSIPSCETHTWGEWSEDNASCTQGGTQTRVCSVCGETDTRETERLPHTVKDFAKVEPTCADPGREAGTMCEVCEAVLSGGQTIPPTGDHQDANNDGACDTCGKTMPTQHDHNYSILVSNTATCTSAGVKTMRCSAVNCDKTEATAVPTLGHDFKDVTSKRATCTAIGWSAHRACSRCGAKEDYTEFPALGHNFDPVTRVCKNGCGTVMDTAGMNAGGWFETLYAEIDGVTDAQVAQVVYRGPVSGTLEDADLEYLVRDAKLSSGKNGVRIDIPGLPAGTYSLLVLTTSGMPYTATNIEVKEYDRSGYAHKVHTGTDKDGNDTGLQDYTEGVGAYRDDGILKDNALVIYVTDENKNRISVTASDGTTVSGIGNILNTVGKDEGGGLNKNGGKANSNQDILKKLALENRPLVVRIVGTVYGGGGANPGTPIEGLTAYDSIDYGGTVGDNGFMARMQDCQNITIEGIGPDARIHGWGFHVMCGTAGYTEYGLGKNFEFRNLTFEEVPEDCIGLEGIQSAKNTNAVISAPVRHGWVHNCSFYPAHIASPAESDKKDGDGSMDFKRGKYFTLSYCYFEGAHKTNLIGSADYSLQFHITWHHNWWKNCEARGPLVRNSNIHIYDCLYESQRDYAQNPRADAYIFSEYNTFLNCKQARGVEGGAIKSYMDSLGSALDDGKKGGPATTVTDKTQLVDCNNKYKNFDTNPALSYIPSGDYQLDSSTLDARAKIYAYTGPMKAQMVTPEEVWASTVPKELTPAAPLSLPFDKDLTAIAASDNVVLNGVSGTKFGKGTDGKNIVFTVAEDVNVTVDASAKIALINADTGNAVIRTEGTATANDLPAGTYYIQPDNFQPAKDSTGAGFDFKDGNVTHLKITAASAPAHQHSFGDWTQTAEPTCLKVGTETRTCAGCGEVERRDVEKIDHHYVDGVCEWCELAEGVYDPNVGGGETPTPPTLVAVTGVSVDEDMIYVDQGKTRTLRATVAPADATRKSVTWTSDDPEVATVTAAGGMVKGIGSGTTTITATTKDGGFTASCVVRVIGVTPTTKKFIASDYTGKTHDGAVTEADRTEIATKTDGAFTLNKVGGTWRVQSGKTVLVLAKQGGNAMEFSITNPLNTVKINASCTGSNWSVIALLDSDGKRVADKNGKTVQGVTGTAAKGITFENLPVGTYQIVSPVATPEEVGGGASGFESRGVAIHSVTVEEIVREDDDRVLVTSVALSGPNTVEMGQHITLTATVLPEDATTTKLKWTSSDTKIAVVSANGVVTGARPGTVTITAAATDISGKKDTMTITVTPAIVDRGNLGKVGEQVTWTLDREGELVVTDGDHHLANDDVIFVGIWDVNDKFAGVKLIKASQLEAQLGTGWDHAKLIWLNSQRAPKCEAVEATLE